MNTLRAALLTALLGILALLIAWGLRPGTVESRQEIAAASADAGVKMPAPPPKRDFPRRPAAQDAVFADPPEDDGPEIVHPWSAYLNRCAEIDAILRKNVIDLDHTDKPLTDILPEIAEKLGLKLNLDCPAEITAKRISFAVKDLMALHVLRLLLQQYDLMQVVGEDGEIWIISRHPMPAEDQPVWAHEPAFMGELRAMKLASGEFAPKKPVEPSVTRNETALSEAMKSKRISLSFTETSLPEVVSFFQEVTELNLMIDRRHVDDPEATVVSMNISDASVDEALGSCLKGTDLGYYMKQGVLIVTTQEHIEQMRTAADLDVKLRREIAAAEKDLLSRPVAFGAENMRLRDVADILAKGLGVPYQIDPGTWSRKARYTIEERQRPASEIVALLKKGAPLIVAYRNGILWFLSPEGVK
ncbi:MAG: STN domain-containing protein [Planctomycetota bacterium]